MEQLDQRPNEEQPTSSAGSDRDLENHDGMISTQAKEIAHDEKGLKLENEMPEFVPRIQHQQVLDKIQLFEERFADMEQRQRQREELYADSSDSNDSDEYMNSEMHSLFEVFMSHVGKLKAQKRFGRLQLKMARKKYAGLEVHRDEDIDNDKDETPSETQLLLEGAVSTPEHLDWKTFRFWQPSQATFMLHPIQVLIGEPEVLIGSYKHKGVKDKSDSSDYLSETKKTAKNGDSAESRPLPERIRIISQSLMTSLSKVFGDDEYIVAGKAGVTILRPYKVFLYWESKIRNRVAEVEETLAAHKSSTITEESHGCYIALQADQIPQVQREDTPSTTKQDTSNVAEDTGMENNSSEDKDYDDLILQKSRNEACTEAIQLRCLLGFMDSHILPRLKSMNDDPSQTILFDDLWHLYKPGDEVIERAGRQAYRVMRITTPVHNLTPSWSKLYRRESRDEPSEKPFKIRCVYIDFDGKILGPVIKDIHIPRYDGERAIDSLPVIPFRFSRPKIDRNDLIQRGRMLLEVATVKSMYYMGLALDTRDEVDSQVVVDFNEALADEDNEDWVPKIQIFTTSDEKDDAGETCRADCCRHDAVYNDSKIDKKRAEDFFQSLLPKKAIEKPSMMIYPRSLREATTSGNTPSDDELVVMTYRVFAFVLRTRKWAQLDAGLLRSENEYNNSAVKTAFERLILPNGHKNVVQALVTQHFSDKKKSSSIRDEQSDIVRGKGKGLIILLHGAPGVGKTTTAEGVAELFKKPLFQITCGDLGTTAFEVEEELERNFALASRWECILLLDEADVFLAQRERKDFVRNGLVAVFLRVLEYYSGILFLTTNRVGDFDEAFASRIHMSLYYPELDKEQTKQIFDLNLKLIRGRFKAQNRQLTFDDSAIISFAEQHFDKYEHARWNGRQIRNASQTALALAEFEALGESTSLEVNNSSRVDLKQDHFTKVQAAYLAFAKYQGEMFGTDGDKRAEDNRLRARAEKGNDPPSKLMQRAAEKSQAPFKSHQNENVGSRYNDNEFQPTSQHIPGTHQFAGHVPPQAMPLHQQAGSLPARYGHNASLGVQQNIHTYAQSSGLQQANIPTQPGILYDSQGQPVSYPPQNWPGTNPGHGQLAYPRQMPVAQQPVYNQSYIQPHDGSHLQNQPQSSEQPETQGR